MNSCSALNLCKALLYCSANPSADETYSQKEQRFVMLRKHHPHDDLGIHLAGGNAVGIFVHSVQPSSVAGNPNGLRCGDQILEVGNVTIDVGYKVPIYLWSQNFCYDKIFSRKNVSRLQNVLFKMYKIFVYTKVGHLCGKYRLGLHLCIVHTVFITIKF